MSGAECEMSADEIPDVKCWRTEFRMWKCPAPPGYPEQLHPDSPRWHVARSPIQTLSRRSTRHSWTSHSDDSISYLDMLFGSLTKVSKPCYSPRSAAILSGHLLLLAFWICLWQRTSKLRFFMFLSFPLLCHGFQRTLLNLWLLWWSKSYQNTKT